MVESFCGLFSVRTGTIAILSYPVLTFLQSFISRLYINTGYSADIWKVDLVVTTFVCFCVIGLIGVEQKKPSFLKPVLWIIMFLIFSIIFADILYILDCFQIVKKFGNHLTDGQFQYSLIVELVLMYAWTIIFGHYTELQLKEPFKSSIVDV